MQGGTGTGGAKPIEIRRYVRIAPAKPFYRCAMVLHTLQCLIEIKQAGMRNKCKLHI